MLVPRKAETAHLPFFQLQIPLTSFAQDLLRVLALNEPIQLISPIENIEDKVIVFCRIS